MAKHLDYDIAIIGSGIAGLSAALAIQDHAKVCILTKSHIKEGATQWAQGGIAVALNREDAPDYHLKDTLKAGAGLCDTQAVKHLVEEGPKLVEQLIALGANFDREDGQFHFTKEAAHQKRRILHAGDATGREIEKTLGNTLLNDGKVNFYPNTFVHSLIQTETGIQGCIALQGQDTLIIRAKAVIIATGGSGQLFAHNTNPPVATGDGIALAYQCGADIQDMEFTQFHPTTLYTGDKKPISIFLISEALRGEGALLRNKVGERFMTHYHPEAELAPRDIVSRAICREMKKTNTENVYLDLSGVEGDLKQRFPTIFNRCLDAKIDIRRDFIPVAPAAHYFMGGIHIDYNGATTIKGLYAAGECTSLGLHGANRLASNSLLEGLVFGTRAARHALDQLPETHCDLDQSAIEQRISQLNSLDRKQLTDVFTAKHTLRWLMWNYVGIERNQSDLDYTLTQLDKLNWLHTIETKNVSVLEVQNMHTVAVLMAKAASLRTESRGGHYRSDYPDTNAEQWQCHILHSRNKDPQKIPVKIMTQSC